MWKVCVTQHLVFLEAIECCCSEQVAGQLCHSRGFSVPDRHSFIPVPSYQVLFHLEHRLVQLVG